RFEPAKASFRTYLRMAVERFAVNQHVSAHRQKRGGEIRFEPVEEPDVAGESPDDAFEREWRRQVFSLALEDLRGRAAREGKQVPLAIFEAYDLEEGERPSYATLAARHGIAET